MDWLYFACDRDQWQGSYFQDNVSPRPRKGEEFLAQLLYCQFLMKGYAWIYSEWAREKERLIMA
jgi:hypothetical protein